MLPSRRSWIKRRRVTYEIPGKRFGQILIDSIKTNLLFHLDFLYGAEQASQLLARVQNILFAKRYFSFTVLERRLQSILADCLEQQI
jgi:hypothetical protein